MKVKVKEAVTKKATYMKEIEPAVYKHKCDMCGKLFDIDGNFDCSMTITFNKCRTQSGGNCQS